MLKLEEFDKMATEFLKPLDDERDTEYFETEWRRASDVMSLLRVHLYVHLYQADFEREARYEQYLKLRAEFGGDAT